MQSYAHIKQGWYEVGGKTIFCRSRYEMLFACWCEHSKSERNILDWEHEPKTFWFEGIKRGCVSYKPDFKIFMSPAFKSTMGGHYWVELKGYMDSKSATKIKRFKKYFPEESLVVLGDRWIKEHMSDLKNIEQIMNGKRVEKPAKR